MDEPLSVQALAGAVADLGHAAHVRWLAYAGDDVGDLAADAVVAVLLFYVANLPVLLGSALRALRARSQVPSSRSYTSSERAQRLDRPLELPLPSAGVPLALIQTPPIS